MVISPFRRILLKSSVSLSLPAWLLLSGNATAQAVGSAMKLFPAQMLNGEMFDPESVKGKVVLLYTWASWCPYCLRDLPTLRDKQQALRDKGFEIIGINLDIDPALAEKWIDTHKVNFTSIKFTADYRQAYMPNRVSTPAWWLARRDGTVVDSSVGQGAEFVYRQRASQLEDQVNKK